MNPALVPVTINFAPGLSRLLERLESDQPPLAPGLDCPLRAALALQRTVTKVPPGARTLGRITSVKSFMKATPSCTLNTEKVAAGQVRTSVHPGGGRHGTLRVRDAQLNRASTGGGVGLGHHRPGGVVELPVTIEIPGVADDRPVRIGGRG